MSPLQALILDRMRQRGWSPKDVEDRGVKHATLHRYMNPVELKQPPRRSVLQSLATALELPLATVQRAAVQSVGYDYESAEPTNPTEVADLEEAIDRDPRLLPETRAHLRNQLELLLRIQGASPELLARQEERRQRALTEQEALTSIHEELEQFEEAMPSERASGRAGGRSIGGRGKRPIGSALNHSGGHGPPTA